MMKVKAAYIIGAICVLAACSTPQERCIGRVQHELVTVSRLIDQLQVNLARGYAVEQYETQVAVDTVCSGVDAEGRRFRFECEKTTSVTREKNVAIDVEAERKKLESLLARQTQMKAAYDGQVAECIARHPEE